MTTDPWKIPYPSDHEIERQAGLIVKAAFQEKPSFFEQVQDVKNRMGWLYLMPNRSETIVASLILFILLFFVTIVFGTESRDSGFLYSITFFISPLPLGALILYSLYEKQNKKVFDLEMTTKITIYQVIAFRILSFSAIALLTSMTTSLLLALYFEMPFVRIFMISLTGLFIFTAILLSVFAKYHIWYGTWGVIGAWGLLNVMWLLLKPEDYFKFLESLPLLLYSAILMILIGLYVYTFRKAFMRKPEGVWPC